MTKNFQAEAQQTTAIGGQERAVKGHLDGFDEKAPKEIQKRLAETALYKPKKIATSESPAPESHHL